MDLWPFEAQIIVVKNCYYYLGTTEGRSVLCAESTRRLDLEAVQVQYGVVLKQACTQPNFFPYAENARFSVDFFHYNPVCSKVSSIIRVTDFLKSYEPFTPSMGPCKSLRAHILPPPNLSPLSFRSLEMIYMGFTILLMSAPMAQRPTLNHQL